MAGSVHTKYIGFCKEESGYSESAMWKTQLRITLNYYDGEW